MRSAFIPVIIAALAVSACASKSTFVLLPEEDGSVGELTLTNAGGTQVMTGAYWSIDVSSATRPPPEPGMIEEAEVAARFGDIISATPIEPQSFILYFGSTAEDLTPESEVILNQVVEAFQLFPAPEIRVIGHTDTTGASLSNDALSLQRAEAIRNLLVENGVPTTIIEIASHGETDLLIETADEVREPRNRRVEVNIR